MLNEVPPSRLDYAFAQFLVQRCNLNNELKKQFENIVIQLSYAQSQGHSCIEISGNDQDIILASGMV